MIQNINNIQNKGKTTEKITSDIYSCWLLNLHKVSILLIGILFYVATKYQKGSLLWYKPHVSIIDLWNLYSYVSPTWHGYQYFPVDFLSHVDEYHSRDANSYFEFAHHPFLGTTAAAIATTLWGELQHHMVL